MLSGLKTVHDDAESIFITTGTRATGQIRPKIRVKRFAGRFLVVLFVIHKGRMTVTKQNINTVRTTTRPVPNFSLSHQLIGGH